MLHQLIIQIAQLGGEATIALLVLVSIVSVAIISNRIWFFVQNWIDTDQFALQLLQALAAQDWLKARTAARKSTASICVVMTAGLSQAGRGRRAVFAAMRSARIREQNRMEGQLSLLGILGRSALLLGILGTIFDVLQFARFPEINQATSALKRTADAWDAAFILGPAAAGLIVGIPALLAAGLLKSRVRQSLRQIDSLGQMLSLQIPSPPRGEYEERSTRSQAA